MSRKFVNGAESESTIARAPAVDVPAATTARAPSVRFSGSVEEDEVVATGLRVEEEFRVRGEAMSITPSVGSDEPGSLMSTMNTRWSTK